MKILILAAAVVAAVGALSVKDGLVDMDTKWWKENLVNKDIKMKETIIMKLLNHILQPTIYHDIRECSRDFVLENNIDKFIKTEVVKVFLETYRVGMMPRGEIFVHTSEKQMVEAIKVFHLLYFAKDFDTFVRTACWLRERINEGIFVYALTVACLHREDCRGITLPAPYEIYPYLFVNSDVIHKAFMMKMKKGVVDPVLLNYYNIKVNDKNMVVIDTRKGVRHTMTVEDRLAYFTEDIDLNVYYHYFLADYPMWMVDDIFTVNKERKGEVVMYGMQQLLARYRLERLSHEMCDIKPLMLKGVLETGYWPKLRMSNGEEMPARMNDKVIVTEDNIRIKRVIDDMERIIRTAILTGRFEMRDGTVLKIKKPEDLEILCRMILGNLGWKDDAKTIHLMGLMTKLINNNQYNINKYTYVPTALDLTVTCLRDPVFWRLMKRVVDNVVLFKKMLPKYTREELDFPGVKVEGLVTDKLVTFMDEYDMDITNALYLDKTEVTKQRSDMLFIARQRRLNHQPFKVTVDVVSDKTVDAVVRLFLGPKYDCMGRLMDVNDKRLDMVEIDSFIYKLDTGKNVIVRDSTEMHNIIGDRPMTRRWWDRNMMDVLMGGVEGQRVVRESWWHHARTGFPHRLLLPMGRLGGLELQLYVIVTPVRTGMVLPTVDMDVMKTRKVCRFTVCMDTMPLGFPFDRDVDVTKFRTNNMKWTDVMVFHKELETANGVRDVDVSDMVMKHDDYTVLDKDMLVRTRFMDPVMMDDDRMMRM